ncbi:YozQ family protein [Halobacillus sp. H74]|uniref:YozQ family protein n=1 Tax=Halobacillus sp. H74 TaxID=3457436 RepID=UPI003FCC8E8B
MKKKKDQDVRNYQPSDYEKEDFVSKGLATTHEQVSDTLTEGTFDGKIDEVDKNGNLVTHKGKEIKRKRK